LQSRRTPSRRRGLLHLLRQLKIPNEPPFPSEGGSPLAPPSGLLAGKQSRPAFYEVASPLFVSERKRGFSAGVFVCERDARGGRTPCGCVGITEAMTPFPIRAATCAFRHTHKMSAGRKKVPMRLPKPTIGDVVASLLHPLTLGFGLQPSAYSRSNAFVVVTASLSFHSLPLHLVYRSFRGRPSCWGRVVVVSRQR
jgi:hypothetical protein